MHSKTSKKELETETIKIKQKQQKVNYAFHQIQLKRIMNFAYNKKQPLVKSNLKFIFVTKQGKRTHKTDGQKRLFPVVRHFE